MAPGPSGLAAGRGAQRRRAPLDLSTGGNGRSFAVLSGSLANRSCGRDPSALSGDPDPGETPRWEIFTHGGRKPTGLDAVEWAKKMEGLGAGEILLTSMDQDGMKNGFDLGVTRAISDALGIPVIASGGVGNLQHLADGILEGHASAVLAASIFHFGEYTVPEAKAYMASRGIVVR